MQMNWCLSLLLLTSSCVANNSLGTSAESQKNVNNLARISIGMSEGEVWQIMKKPHAQEEYTVNEDHYEVWFYVTTPTALGQSRMVTANLTPLSFKNGTLVAVGNDYYKWIVKQDRLATEQTNQQAAPKQIEDTDLEKALAPTPNQSPKTAPQKTPPPNQPPNTSPRNPPNQSPKTSPQKPTTPNQSPKTKGELSMCSKPKDFEPPVEPTKDKPKAKNKPPITEEDDDLLEEESGQNFNFW